MVALNGRRLEGSVHPLDLTVGPGMVWLSQSVLDTVRITKPVEHMDAPPRSRSETVLRQISELDAVISEHGMDFVEHGLIKALSGDWPSHAARHRRTLMSDRLQQTDRACLPRSAPQQYRDGSSLIRPKLPLGRLYHPVSRAGG
jgi:hypothetical protein